MSDRFVRLFELPANLYSIGSPIIISQAVLLRDIQTESVIAQMKFQSISTKSIKALKISLSAFDITGKVLEGALDYSYLDLSIEDGQTFGSNKAIVFVPPRSSSRMELPWTYSCHFNRCQRQCLLAALWLITNSLSSISLVQITLRNVSHKMLMNYGNVPVADGISKINVHNAKQIENLFFLLTM